MLHQCVVVPGPPSKIVNNAEGVNQTLPNPAARARRCMPVGASGRGATASRDADSDSSVCLGLVALVGWGHPGGLGVVPVGARFTSFGMGGDEAGDRMEAGALVPAGRPASYRDELPMRRRRVVSTTPRSRRVS